MLEILNIKIKKNLLFTINLEMFETRTEFHCLNLFTRIPIKVNDIKLHYNIFYRPKDRKFTFSIQYKETTFRLAPKRLWMTEVKFYLDERTKFTLGWSRLKHCEKFLIEWKSTKYKISVYYISCANGKSRWAKYVLL